MTTTPADPGAIDLEVIRPKCHGVARNALLGLPDLRADCLTLIAAVEALREREKQTLVMIADILDKEMKLSRRAEAAEARGMELAVALDKIAHSGPVDQEGNDDAEAGWSWCYDVARAALIATPARAIERARAVEEVVKAARAIAETAPYLQPEGELRSALAKLDALGKE